MVAAVLMAAVFIVVQFIDDPLLAAGSATVNKLESLLFNNRTLNDFGQTYLVDC